MPRRRIRPRAREHLVFAETYHALVGILDALRAREHGVDLELVIVAGHHEALDVAVRELRIGELQPALELAAHHAGDDALAVLGVLLESPVLVLGAAVRIEAVEADPLLELRGRLLAPRHLVTAEHVRRPLARSPFDERDERLACDVAAQDQHVGLVERGGVEELAPALLGPVDVARVVEPHSTGISLKRRATSTPRSRCTYFATK